jgi:hypothetical protein
MATGIVTLPYGNDSVKAVIGSGTGEGDLTLCSISIGAQERGVRITGLAWSSMGDRLAVDGVGATMPDDGVSSNAGALFFAGHAALPYDQVANRIDLVVNGSSGVVWRGYLRAEAVGEYSI